MNDKQTFSYRTIGDNVSSIFENLKQKAEKLDKDYLITEVTMNYDRIDFEVVKK